MVAPSHRKQWGIRQKMKMEKCLIKDNHRLYLIEDVNVAKHDSNLIVIQKNPSWANGKKSDSTAGKVLKWAREHNFGKVIFLNLFSYITSKADILDNNNLQFFIHTETDGYIRKFIEENPSATIVAAWGNNPKSVSKDDYDKRIRM